MSAASLASGYNSATQVEIEPSESPVQEVVSKTSATTAGEPSLLISGGASVPAVPEASSTEETDGSKDPSVSGFQKKPRRTVSFSTDSIAEDEASIKLYCPRPSKAERRSPVRRKEGNTSPRLERGVELRPWRPFPCAVPLRGVVQHYAWGQQRDSAVAAMATGQVRSKRGPLRAPPMSRGMLFAELWMGTHPSGPSSVVVPSSSAQSPQSACFGSFGDVSSEGGEREEWFLKDLIVHDPRFWLGEECQAEDISFVFKVLSVQQALPVQVHPSKASAERLHKRFPSAYTDDNHKPKLCIPVGHFEALCGFRPTEQIREYVRTVKELGDLCVENEETVDSDSIRVLYSRLLASSPRKLSQKVGELVARLRQESSRTPEEDLILRISLNCQGDAGVFSVFFLNYVRITADMAHRYIYCAPCEPHAYLLGECVECMTLSDNVVRAGLTPKYKDIDTLLDVMTYRDDMLEALVGTADQLSPNVFKYDPPVTEFLIYEISGVVEEGLRLPKAAIAAQLVGSSSISFVGLEEASDGQQSAGERCAQQTLMRGQTVFSKAGTTLYVSHMEEGAKLFIATS